MNLASSTPESRPARSRRSPDAEPLAAVLRALRDADLDRTELRQLMVAGPATPGPAALLAASGLLVTCGADDNRYDGFIDAIGIVEAARPARAALGDASARLLADAGDLVARWFASLEDPALPALADGIVVALADDGIDRDLRTVAAIAALSFFNAQVNPEKVWWADLAMRPLLADPAVAARLRGEWQNQLVYSYYTCSDVARADAVRRDRVVGEHAVLALKLALIDARVAIGEGRADAGREALQRSEPWLDGRRPTQAGEWHFLSSRLCMLDKRLAEALAHARLSLRMFAEASYPEPWMGSVVMQEGQVQMLRGAPLEAAPFFDRAARASTGAQSDYCRCLADFAIALGRADAGEDAAARAALANGFGLARRLGWSGFFRASPAIAARLCALALDADVEAAFVRSVVADRQLEASRPELASWPWAVRIRTLGRFNIEVDHAPLALRGKAARKPLELLQFVIASGGVDVAANNVTFALWPDLDGDNARSAFNVALHRLRKLLRSDAAIVLELGRLSLDSRSVWVDCLAFETLANQAEPPLTAAGIRSAHRALKLYAGHFLHADDDHPWQAVTRTRLASKFKRLARALASESLAAGDVAAARSVLERALEVDPVAEDLARELIRLFASQGETGAALAVFERSRAALANVLGAQPAAVTLELVATLRPRPSAPSKQGGDR